ncbi:MAG: hypothetical protein ACFB6R_07405 [Alphaproteobacteria bacterium]
MAFRRSGDDNKQYLFPSIHLGQGMNAWVYVTTDSPAVVENCGYFSDDLALETMQVGDMLWVYQVAGITDSKTLQEDLAGGLIDLSLHVVLVNTGTVLNLSDDLLAATVTYTS